MLRSLSAMFWALSVILVPVSILKAEGTTVCDLRSVEFALPSDWKVTGSQRDQEYDFVSPDGQFELWARWWFPDEPLIGYDDIIRHEKRQMAGQEALFIHRESGGTRSLEVAFLNPDAEDELFLWQLHSSTASLAEHEAMFDSLLAGLRVDDQPALTVTAPSSSGSTGAAVPPEPMFVDPGGRFALPLPQGWTVQTTASQGLRQAVLIAPSRDSLVLAATASADRGMTAGQVLDEYLGVLYRDAVIVKSIEDEAYPDIAGTTAHAVETIAKIYAINGVALPYARGRVWIYRADDGANAGAPFLIISIRSEAAPPALTEVLSGIATGFTFDTAAASATGVPPEPAQEPSLVAGMDPLPAQLHGLSAAPPLQGLIFDGKTLAGLVPFAFNSVSFDENAKLTGNAIAYSFPDGSGSAKLGFATPVAVVTMPGREGTTAQRISAVIDATQSSGISFAFVAPADAQNDPDEANDLKVQFSTIGDGIGNLVLTTRDPKQSLTASFLWPGDEAVLNLLLRPDQTLDVRDGSGAQLADLALNGNFAGRQWALQTFLEAHQRNSAVALVLKRLSVDTVAYQPAPSLDPIATGPQSAVIFDGYAFGRIWEPVSRSKSQIASFIRLSDGALRVGWTAEDKGTWSGMSTPEAALWLDRFTGAAEARVDLALDGAASKDFEIALQGPYTLPGNLSGADSYVLGFTQDADGTYTVLSALRSQEKVGLKAAGLVAIPDRISLVLTPDGVRVKGEGMPDGILAFPQLQDGAGFRIAIHARNTAANDAALVLRGVRMALRPGEAAHDPEPQPGVAPLPQTVFFDAKPDQNWEGRSVASADYSALSKQLPDGLTLSRHEPVTDWNRIALVGTQAVVDLDYRVDTTPYEVVVKLDPATGLGTRIFLHTNVANFKDAAQSVVTLRELTTGPEAGGLEVQLHTGHFSYDRWRRVLPAAQWRTGWDGTVRLRFGPTWIALGLGDDWLMRGYRTARQMMMAITPGGAGNTDGGTVTLQRITGGWVTPDGMTARQRQTLIEIKDFDPIQFLDLLNAE